MQSLVGIFHSSDVAETALKTLRAAGLSDDQLLLLTPQSITDLHVGRLPTPHPHGACGITAGHVLGAIIGFAGGTLLAAVATLFLTGRDPITAIMTLVLGSLIGTGIGAIVGRALQQTFATPLSYEDLLVYSDALRHGGELLIVAPSDEGKSETVRQVFTQLGAEQVEEAREHWWHRLQESEAAAPGIPHDGFTATEVEYFRGFEAALDPRVQGQSYEEAVAFLHEKERAVYQEESFRRGFERGRAYQQARFAQEHEQSTSSSMVH